MNFVIVGSSPPNSLKMPTNTGTMKATRPSSVRPAKAITTAGYIMADLTLRLSDSSASSWLAIRISDSSSTPPVSPAPTIDT